MSTASLRLASLWLLWACSSIVAETLDCSKIVEVSGQKFDLSQLKDEGVWKVESTVDTPPTTRKSLIETNLCDALPRNSKLPDSDQCPAGTRVCMTISNLKDGQDERITSVQPLAGDIGKGDLNPELSLGSPSEQDAPAPLQIKLHGGEYGTREQSTMLVLTCKNDQSEVKPESHAYNLSTGLLTLEFSSSKFCATDSKDKGGDDSSPDRSEPSTPGGSRRSGGWGFFSWLFFLIFSGLALYFAVGMWIRHSQYDARGWDMLPHRDFWADLPYVIKDLVSSRRNTGGYAAI